MQKVKFSGRYDHITPMVTTVYGAGAEETVKNEIAEAARAAGKLEEGNGGQSDKGGASSGSATGEGHT